MKRNHLILKCLLSGSLALFAILSPIQKSSASETSATAQATAEQNIIPLHNEETFLPINSKQKSIAPNASLSKYQKKIFQGDTETLWVTDVPENCDISFKSSDSSVLSIEQTGAGECQYTGVRSGTAKIIIKITKSNFIFFEEKKIIRAKVTVSPHAASIMFQHSTRKIRKGQKIKLTTTLRPSITKEKPVFWSSNRKIATISKKGFVYGKKVGSTYVVASISNGKTARCKIIVRKRKDDA